MGQTEKKIFNEGKYQKNRKVMNYVGMAVVVLSIVVGGSVMYLGNRLVRKEIFTKQDNSSIQKNVEKKVILEDGSLVAVPHTQEEYQEALARVDAQYPNHDIRQEGYNSEENMARFSDRNELEEAYRDYIDSQHKKDDDMFGQMDKVSGVMFKVFFTIISIFPGFIIMVIGVTVGSKILVMANGRGIAGFFTQSAVPVVKETIEEIAPTIGKVKKDMIDTVSPSIGKATEEIARGIKKGLADQDKE